MDEGFPDDNGDGFADCLTVDCPDLPLAPAGPTADRVCGSGPTVVDPWKARVEWGFTATSGYQVSLSTPVVGNLDDDDGDGVVSASDVPDVVVVGGGIAYALDGATGAFKWEVPSAGRLVTATIADVDADGAPDVVIPDAAARIVVYDGAGVEKATSVSLGNTAAYAVSVADLDGDGHPEIIADGSILAGDSLVVLSTFDPSRQEYTFNAVGDVDRDGDQEIFRDGRLYDSDGTLLWDAGTAFVSTSFPALVQADDDPEAELVLVSDRFRVFDTDGTLLAAGLPFSYDTWGTGLPTAGDFDGDGALEVLYAADEAFYIYDGRTGAALYTWTDHTSQTGFEFAVIADLDRDDQAEVVMVGDHPFAVTALENDGAGWPPAGPTWSGSDYSVTTANNDGSVPAHPDPAWLTDRVYRARPWTDGEVVETDLRVAITDVCIADCVYGSVAVAVQVSNAGALAAGPGARLVLYALDEAGDREIASAVLPIVPAGEALEGVEFDLAPADIGELGFAAVVDADGVIPECDEGNNRDEWTDTPCQ